jgi:hypothetical protein
LRETGQKRRERRELLRRPEEWLQQGLPTRRRGRREEGREAAPNPRRRPAPTWPVAEASSGRADWSAQAPGWVDRRKDPQAESSGGHRLSEPERAASSAGHRPWKPVAGTRSLVRPQARLAPAGVGPGRSERSPPPAGPARPAWSVRAEPAAPARCRLRGASVSPHSGRNWSPDQPQRCRTERIPSLDTLPVVRVGAVSGLLSVDPPRISPCGYRHLTRATRDSA